MNREERDERDHFEKLSRNKRQLEKEILIRCDEMLSAKLLYPGDIYEVLARVQAILLARFVDARVRQILSKLGFKGSKSKGEDTQLLGNSREIGFCQGKSYFTLEQRKGMTVDKKEIGKRIKKIRVIDLDMNQDKFSRKLAISQPTASRYEKGKVIPPADILLKIAKLGKTTIEKILEGG